MQSTALKGFAIKTIEELKGLDIKALDVRNVASYTDFIVICTGRSNRHVKSIAENLLKEAKTRQLHVIGCEGINSGEWVLVDLGDVIVHIMQQQARDHYQLEKLWAADPSIKQTPNTHAH